MDQPPRDNGAERRASTEPIGSESPTQTHPSPDAMAPTDTLVAGTVGDRCVSCGAPLSSDQRYCVVCGERRGAPRFTLPPATAVATETTSVSSVPRPARALPRLGVGAVIAGVATLLLAMLVGVLIGHNTASNGARTVASAPVRIIKVGGTSGGGSSSGSSGGSGSSSATGSHTHAGRSKAKSKSSASKPPPITKQAAAKESTAASKVLGGKSTPPATVTVGQTGSGAGFNKKTHKFDGSFFGQ